MYSINLNKKLNLHVNLEYKLSHLTDMISINLPELIQTRIGSFCSKAARKWLPYFFSGHVTNWDNETRSEGQKQLIILPFFSIQIDPGFDYNMTGRFLIRSVQ